MNKTDTDDAMSIAEICDALQRDLSAAQARIKVLEGALQWIMLRGVRQQAEGGYKMDFQDASREQSDRARAALKK